MENKRLAGQLIRMARILCGFIMTENEWKSYKKLHPRAERSHHHIVHSTEGDKGDYDAIIKRLNVVKKEHPRFIPLVNKRELLNTIKNKVYSVISAGGNPNHKDEADLREKSPELYEKFVNERTEQLRKDLDALNVSYTEVIGDYSGEEVSFLVNHSLKAVSKGKQASHLMLSNHDAKLFKKLDALGEKYNQDSVLHSVGGIGEFHYTSGEKKGNLCRGKGTRIDQSADNFYSEAQVGRGEYTKWQADMADCITDHPTLIKMK